tara:strand:+ start:141 stop:1187 length:1047 start_codon:yes stop_codon:yes gene_type:complete
MKFLNKKEQVMDFKLTSYGHYLMSVGKFKPEFYAFFDDNVIYDGQYGQISESSNRTHQRIKENTQYLESQVLFEEVETDLNVVDGSLSFYESDVTPIMKEPRKDIYRFDSMIGDAYLAGDTNISPAWKIVSLNGNISSSTLKDPTNDYNIPQINITLNYRKKIVHIDKVNFDNYLSPSPAAASGRGFVQSINRTNRFADNKIITLETDDLIIYAEELNTEMLNENFDTEVFEILTGALPARCPTCAKQDKLSRKYFQEDRGKIRGGLMSDSSINNFSAQAVSNLSSSVDYYFDIIKDHDMDAMLACKGVEMFNKQTLYIDLDFDCENFEKLIVGTADIYGRVTEPEQC